MNTPIINVTSLTPILQAAISADKQVTIYDQEGIANRANIVDVVAAAAAIGSGGLDAAYDSGGAGVGRTIIADTGAVKIEGADGLLVTGVFGTGAVSEWVGAALYNVGMFFNPIKGAFRAGRADAAEWDAANVGIGSIGIGRNTTASGEDATAIGRSTLASGDRATALGDSAIASGEGSTAMGNQTIASGDRATAIGSNTTALSFVETVIGFWNTVYAPVSTVAWNAADRVFSIANGQSSVSRSDAFIVLKSGKITCPSTTGSFTPNVLTTTERNALTATAGMLVYNSTTNKHQGYDGAIWNDLF